MQALASWGSKSPIVAEQSQVIARLAELAKERGITHKELAALLDRPGNRKGTKTPQLVGAALRGRSNMLLADAEKIAKHLDAPIEPVIHGDPVDAFRRALNANKDLDPVIREDIWTLFERGKFKALRARPKKLRAAGSSR